MPCASSWARLTYKKLTKREHWPQHSFQVLRWAPLPSKSENTVTTSSKISSLSHHRQLWKRSSVHSPKSPKLSLNISVQTTTATQDILFPVKQLEGLLFSHLLKPTTFFLNSTEIVYILYYLRTTYSIRHVFLNSLFFSSLFQEKKLFEVF